MAAVCHWRGDDLLLTLHIQPGARESAFAGIHGDALKIRVKAAPVDGQANRELCRFVAGAFGVAASQVELLGGESSRHKRVCVHNPQYVPDALLPFLPRKL